MRAQSLTVFALVLGLFLSGRGWTGFSSTVGCLVGFDGCDPAGACGSGMAASADGSATGQAERPSDKAKPGEVRWIGEMRKVMREGDLTGRVDLRSLAGRPHLYAVGPLEGLRGEVTIWDSKASLATLKKGEVSIDKADRRDFPESWPGFRNVPEGLGPQTENTEPERAGLPSGLPTGSPRSEGGRHQPPNRPATGPK